MICANLLSPSSTEEHPPHGSSSTYHDPRTPAHQGSASSYQSKDRHDRHPDHNQCSRAVCTESRGQAVRNPIDIVYTVTPSQPAGVLLYSAPVISMRIVRDSTAKVPSQIKSPSDLAALLH